MTRRSARAVKAAVAPVARSAAATATQEHPGANVRPGAAESAVGDGWELRRGDCLAGLNSLPDATVDAVVTDPPAGIGFMGRDWDSDKGGRDAWIAWLASVMAECLRVLKPGGHAFVWALPRTSHWTATAVENAGFEIRDVHHHIFGTGFPKSLNVSSVMHELLGCCDGEYGTALKPAVEHWILARRPLVGTYAENIRAHGVGALNVGACRVDGGGQWGGGGSFGHRGDAHFFEPGGDGNRGTRQQGTKNDAGRWPAHLSLDEYAAALLDEQAGERTSGAWNGQRNGTKTTGTYGAFEGNAESPRDASAGGASRFFYVAKGSRAEKDRGLEGMRRITGGEATGRVDGSAGTRNPRAGAGRNGGARNIHPTVKSIELMRWLVRLVTPMSGSLVLDPFAGSGTTGLGALAEGHRFLGFEKDEGKDGERAGYFDIATARLEAATRQQTLPVLAVAPRTTSEKATEQPSLFDAIGGTR